MILADSVFESFALANTPAFLFKRLRADPSVLRASESPAALLVEELGVALSEPGVGRLADAYALLVALLLRGPSGQSAAQGLPLSELEWAPAIMALASSTFVPTEYTRVMLPQRVHFTSLSAKDPDGRWPANTQTISFGTAR